jgi:hypothetical protein
MHFMKIAQTYLRVKRKPMIYATLHKGAAFWRILPTARMLQRAVVDVDVGFCLPVSP